MAKVQEKMVMVNQQHKLLLHGGFSSINCIAILFCCRCQVEEIKGVIISDVCTQ